MMMPMTIFNDLENAIAPYVGGNDAAGAILGITVIIISLFGFLIAFGRDVFRGNTGIVVMLIFVSFVSAPGVDWFPLYVPFMIILTLAFLYWIKWL